MSDDTTKNLIPLHRRQAEAKRKLIRACVLVTAVYTMGIAVACGVTHAMFFRSEGPVVKRIAELDRQIASMRQAVQTLAPEVQSVERKLRANQLLRDRPDWAVLLAIVAQLTNEDLVLRECKLAAIEPIAPPALVETPGSTKDPKETTPEEPESNNPAQFALVLRGIAGTQEQVPQFVLGLEKLELFNAVKLLHTRIEPFGVNQGVGFAVRCVIGDAKTGGGS